MYCTHCGAEINDEAVICVHCGIATHKHQQRVKREGNPLAVIGFIMVFFVTIAGLVSSIIAYRRCKENPNLQDKGLSLAGIIIGAIKLGLFAVYLILYFTLSFI